MRLPTLLLATFAIALLSATGGVGCSDPDVGTFDGSGADEGAAGDDDDDIASKGDDDDDGPVKKKKGASAKTSSTEADTLPDDPKTTKPTKTTPATGGATTTTPEACFTHCVAPVPEAVALDACTSKCADSDTGCLSGCYETSNCGANPQCDQALAQCDGKCFPAQK